LALWLIELPSQAADFTKEIRAAWERRQAAVKSIHLQCSATVTEMVTKVKPNDPFDTPVDKYAKRRPVITKREIEYVMDGEKRATTLAGDHWNLQLEAPVYQRNQVAFDRHQYIWLLETGDIRRAFVGEGWFGKVGPSFSWLTPVYLSLETGDYLKKQEYLIDHSRLKIRDTRYDNKDCLELTLPRVHNGQVSMHWVGMLYVDRTREYLPLAFIGQFDGTPRFEDTATYASDDSIKWVLSQWECKRFAEAGELEETFSAHVKRRRVNTPLDDKLFKLDIPVGTIIIEQDEKENRKHYIQEAGGVRRPVSEKELNKPATGEAA
jgi:hypothetical protein